MWKLFISYIVSKNRRALIPLFSYEHIHEKFLPKKERTKKLFNNLSYFCRVARQKKARIYYTSHAEKELYSFRWLYKLLWFTFNKITEIESMCRNIYIFMLLKQNELFLSDCEGARISFRLHFTMLERRLKIFDAERAFFLFPCCSAFTCMWEWKLFAQNSKKSMRKKRNFILCVLSPNEWTQSKWKYIF